MRQYEQLWYHIRDLGSYSVRRPVAEHKTVIQAVRKEKAGDLGYKFSCLESHCYFKLRTKIKGTTITFSLTSASHI